MKNSIEIEKVKTEDRKKTETEKKEITKRQTRIHLSYCIDYKDFQNIMAKKNIQEKRISDEQTRELQKYILDMLLAIDKVCREHNLCYYLIAGTMLGAVRHKGFVPWDDDADVALPREDYNEFVKHANEW